MKYYRSWYNNDPLTIYFKGSGNDFKKFINSLVEDFNEPHFGYNGELFDEY